MKHLYSPFWRESLLTRDSSIKDALLAIAHSGSLMACMINESGRLIGILTDSDIRKNLLNGLSLDSKIGTELNQNPFVADISSTTEELINFCYEREIREIPLCNSEGILEDIFILGRGAVDEKEHPDESVNLSEMFISAGGKGTRLISVVADRPKPLALVGGKPIIETIIRRAAAAGIKKFYVSVNHMAEMLESHLTLPQYSDLEIKIVKETKPLGTAGAIGFVSKTISHSLLVTNGDILTNASYSKIIRTHNNSNADITCVVRPFTSEVPFGVVEVSQGTIIGLKEKPSFSYLVNAGIYVINKNVLETIEEDMKLDMPSLLEKVIEGGGIVKPFFLHEYWMDIGRPSDFIQANKEFEEYFGDTL